MLQFLETGKALYVLAAFCLLGMLDRLVARNLYKRLIRETDNMSLTKNRYLRDLKQKTENTYRLNQGIRNTQAYLEKQVNSFRFMRVTLSGWGNLSNQMTMLCFLAGGVFAFASYWYRCDTYYIVLYGTSGILTGLLTMVIDNGVNLSDKKQHLLAALQDYMENSLFQRLAVEERSLAAETSAVQENIRGARDRNLTRTTLRTEWNNERSGERGIERNSERLGEAGLERGSKRDGDRNIAERTITDRSERNNPERGALTGRMERDREQDGISDRNVVSVASKRAGRHNRKEPSPVAVETVGSISEKRDADYLKRSLEQIAASREKSRSDENWIKDLAPEELKLIGEIIREYLV